MKKVQFGIEKMLEGKSFLAVIPARAYSSRVNYKNMREMCGQPLIYWVIKAAKESEIFDEIIVLSDGDDVCRFAEKQGVRGVKEPDELATETAYVGDALIWLLNSGQVKRYDYVQLIEPTSPLLQPDTIKSAAEFLIEKDADFVISMCEAEAPNGVAKPIPIDGCVTNWWPEELFAKRSQDCEEAYRVDGLIYVGKWDVWLQRNYWKSKIYAFYTDTTANCDIDNITDFNRAEALLEHRLRHPKKWWRKITTIDEAGSRRGKWTVMAEM